MKKILFYLFFTFFVCSSNLLIAQQNSLDSLRLVLPEGHSKAIYSATFSPNGKIIATCGDDNKILIWDAKTGKLLKTLQGHNRAISSVKFSPNGLTMLSFSEDKSAIIWDLFSGKILFILKDHLIGIGCSNFSPDGKLIITGGGYDGNIGEDTTAKIWDAKSGVLIRTLEGHNNSLNDVVFSPDGKVALTSSRDHSSRIWDVNSGKLLHILEGHTEWVNFANFSPDGKKIITTSDDYSARIWDAKSGKCLNVLKSEDAIKFATYSPDGKLIVTSSWKNNSAQIWETSSGKLIRTINGRMLIYKPNEKINGINPFSLWDCLTGNLIDVQTGKILNNIKIKNNGIDINSEVSISPDGKKILVTGSKYFQRDNEGNYLNFVNVWSFETGRFLYKLNSNSNIINTSYFSVDEKKIITIATDKIYNCIECGSEIGIWELKTGKMLKTFNTHKDIHTANFNSDGKKIVVTFGDSTAQIYDIEYGKLIYSIVCKDSKYGAPSITNAQFSPDGKNILTIHQDHTARLWDASTGIFLHYFEGHTTNYLNGIFSPDSKNIITFSNESARIWDVPSGKLLHILTEANYINNVCYSPDGKTIIITTDLINDGVVMIWDASEGKLLKTLKPGSDLLVTSAEFSPNGKNIIASTYDDKSHIWDVETGELVYTVDGGRYSKYSPNGNLLLTLSSKIRIYNTKTGDLLKVLDYNKSFPSNFFDKANFSSNSKMISLFSSIDPTCPAQVFDIEKGIQICLLKPSTCHFLYNKNINFSTDGKCIITTASDGTIVRNANTGKAIYVINQLKDNNWVVQLPNTPYYMCSKEASKMLHYVTPNLKVIGFEQLDPIYNRPDIVLDSIGNYLGKKDVGMIYEYKKAWEKRIDRLGLDKEKLGKGEFDMPDAEIENADAIPYENSDGEITFHVQANDTNHPLNRYNILVNEVPIYGSQGISLSNLNTRKWDTAVTVPLSIGENKIQVSVMNELGLENFKYPTYVNYVPKSNEIVGKTYYIGIGVDDFKQERINNKETKLNFCVKDVNDLAKVFSEDSNTIVKLYTNEHVNKENILSIKNFLLKNTTVNDRVIISCSSHGLLDKKNNFYLAMHDIDFANPSDRGLAYEELENLLDGIPARKKLLLLDACNSGENELVKNNNQPAENSNKNNVSPIVAARTITSEEPSENNSFHKMNELFINTRNKTGSIIISAAGGRQSALEGTAVKINDKPIENGAFTYVVMEYLKNNKNNIEKLTVNQLKKYVEERVVEITKGKQEPTSRQETMEIDWGLK